MERYENGSVFVTNHGVLMLVSTGDSNGTGSKMISLEDGNRWCDKIIETECPGFSSKRSATLENIIKHLNPTASNKVTISEIFGSLEEYISKKKLSKVVIHTAQQDKQITEEEIENTARKAWVTITDTISSAGEKPILNINHKIVRLMTYEFSKLIKGDKK